MTRALRGLAVIGLAVIAGMFVCMIAVMPGLAVSSAASNRLEHRQILAAGRFADNYRRTEAEWPDEDLLAEASGLPNVSLTPGSWLTFEDGCPSFAGAKSDQFILSTWGGEAFDCLAYPSGRHTFALSVWDYVFGSAGVAAAILLSSILVCLWAIRGLLRG